VYLQQTAPTTLDVIAGRVILRVREVLGSGVLLLEGRDGKFWKDHTRNCAPCLPWLFVMFVLQGGIWSVLLHRS
jgi:hypothetical protein